MARKGYRAHIQSHAWKERRKRFIRMNNSCCETCRQKHPSSKLHLHHLTYERFGDELDSDLKLLCEECHRKVHGMRPRRKKRGSKRMGWKERQRTRPQRYAKLYRPWIAEDREKMKKLGIPIPEPSHR